MVARLGWALIRSLRRWQGSALLSGAALALLIVSTLPLATFGVSLPADVFSRLGGIHYAPGEAVALALPMLGVGLSLLFVERRLLGRRTFAALGGSARRAPPFRLGRWRPLAGAALWGVSALSLLPLLGLAREAGLSGMVGAWEWIGDSLSTSLLVSAWAATVITVIGFVVGHALVRRSSAAALLDAFAMFAFLIPSSILGLGLMGLWNRPLTQLVYTTEIILVIGLAARYMTVGVRTLAAVLHRIPPHLEEAAAIAGIGLWRRLVFIVIPMRWRSFLGAWLIAFVFCMRDLDTVMIFYPPGMEPLPVQIFTLEANGSPPIVAGLALAHVLATFVVLAAVGLVMRIRRRP